MSGMSRIGVTVLAAAVAASGLTVLAAGPASAAPHFVSPASVQVGYTDSADPRTAYDWVPERNLPIGAWQDDTGRTHVSRVYATFDVAALRGKRIISGRVFAEEYSAADCSRRAIEIWRTKAVTKTPSWDTAPDRLAKLDERLTPGTICPGFVQLDVSAAVVDAVAHDKHRITFEIRVPEQYEHDPSYGRQLYWYSSVRLSVQYNSMPGIDERHRYNGGFPCDSTAPYRILGQSEPLLQALATDGDGANEHRIRYDFAVWPQDDPGTRLELVDEFGSQDRVSTVRVPDGFLADGRTYSWQARAGDGADTSPWSGTCQFEVDNTRPSTPQVTSSNYPPADSGEVAPPGEPGLFTFSAQGDPDTAGFYYYWGEPSVPGCTFGELGQLICREPFDEPNTVRADAPGGTVTVSLSPPSSGTNILHVHAVDQAGNRSFEVARYEFFAPFADPIVAVEGDARLGRPVNVRFSPATNVAGTVAFDYRFDSGDWQTVAAGPDGSATISFLASNEYGHSVAVRSRSANGWVSAEVHETINFWPWPGVHSETYPRYEPAGGVGVPGTFVFTPPGTWPDRLQGYRYAFVGDAEYTFVAAGTDDCATISWTPQTSGFAYVEVYAERPDGTLSEPEFYSFEVA